MNLTKHFSNGNMKIGKDTLIFNMGSATTCVAKELGLCAVAKDCYAMKAEIQYPQVKPYRDRQEILWRETSASEFAEAVVGIASRKRSPIKYLRMNESGDFASQADVDKLTMIAVILRSHGIKTYTYSARSDLDFSKLSEVAGINFSGFTQENNGNSFNAVEVFTEGGIQCRMDCRDCHMCKTSQGIVIEVKKH
jgi:hypothetical protein